MIKKHLTLIFTVCLLVYFFGFFGFLNNLWAAEEIEVRDIFFPTEQNTRLTQSFGDVRYGHSHEGEDIMGEQMMELYAAVDGYVSYLVDPEESWGYSVTLKDKDNYTYHYLHINNDTPGTDDGSGGIEQAYAEGVVRGAKVSKGQLIGWMGDSGNAETVGHHLHFEIRRPDKTAIDPLKSLIAALYYGSYDPTEATAASASINEDKSLVASSEATCVSNSLIKLADSKTVYYCGADSKRYVFPNDKIFFTWFDNFENVTILSAEEMASIPLGGNVTYRPGVRMVKITTDPKVYAVERGGVLRHIVSAETAEALYGFAWNQQVDDLADGFFMDYMIGDPILSARP